MNVKSKLARLMPFFLFLFAFLAAAVPAKADPTSISTLITTVSAQATSVITETLPFIAVVIGGVVLFKLIRRFVK